MAASNGEMQLRAMFKAFEDGHRAKGSNPGEALRDIVQSMPDLQQRMETTAEDGRPKGFAVDGKQKSAATYDSDTGIIGSSPASWRTLQLNSVS